jgi:multidrug efflux system membrane fusion protein
MPKFIRIVCLVLLPLVAVSCSSETDSASASGGANAGGGGRAGGRGGRGAGGGAVPVVTAHAVQKAMPVTIPAVGTVEALSTVQLRAQVTGQLSTIHFSEGQDVAKGQKLFSLDARPFQAALQQAEAVLARDTATAQNAQSQKARSDDLFKRGLIARDLYETQNASAASLEATVAADKAALENAKLNLQYTEIAAPISGRTGALGVHVGDLIRANDTTPMVVINQISPVYVTFSVPGRYLNDIRRYQAKKALPVQATMPSAITPGSQSTLGQVGAAAAAPAGRGGAAATPALAEATPERGLVSFIDNSVDPSTGTIRMKGTFQNDDRQLWPGTFVQVALQLTTDADALVVPAASVQASQDGQYVFVVKPDRTVEMRTVRIERQVGDQIVLAEGISPGEEVVTDGQLRLTPGARVTSGRGEGGRGEGAASGERGGAREGRGREGGGGGDTGGGRDGGGSREGRGPRGRANGS